MAIELNRPTVPALSIVVIDQARPENAARRRRC
jgi:hypothetical protein